MSDREERAALEALQVELRSARAELARPFDAAALRAEVGDGIDRLAQEAHALDAKLEALRAEGGVAQEWAGRHLRGRPPPRAAKMGERLVWGVVVGGGPVCGLIASLAFDGGSVFFAGAALILGVWETVALLRR